MENRDYPSTLGECVAKACTYSIQLFEIKAGIGNLVIVEGIGHVIV
jgi:hypothetical protein